MITALTQAAGKIRDSISTNSGPTEATDEEVRNAIETAESK